MVRYHIGNEQNEETQQIADVEETMGLYSEVPNIKSYHENMVLVKLTVDTTFKLIIC